MLDAPKLRSGGHANAGRSTSISREALVDAINMPHDIAAPATADVAMYIGRRQESATNMKKYEKGRKGTACVGGRTLHDERRGSRWFKVRVASASKPRTYYGR